MSLNQISEPTSLPVTVEQAKANGRISVDAEDELVEGLIRSALAHIEAWCGLAFEPQEWEVTLDSFPDSEIALPFGKLVSVIWVRYIDVDGVEAVVDPADYVADTASRDAWVVPVVPWPATMATINAVRVRYICGRGTPVDVARAVLLLSELWYEHRADASETALQSIPFGVRALIDRHTRMFV